MNTMNVSERREFLRALAAMGGIGVLNGCTVVRNPEPVCPNSPEVSGPSTTLTIDTHCHVFNGSDLQVAEFVNRILGSEGGLIGAGAKAIAPTLQRVAWNTALSGAAERAVLRDLSDSLKSCSPGAKVARIGQVRNVAFQAAVKELKRAVDATPEMQAVREKRGPMAVEPKGPYESERAQIIDEVERLQGITVESYRELLAEKGKKSASGIVAFVLQKLQYRYVSVHDYLDTYNQEGAPRFIDLMLPSLVDFDYWLADGKPTITSLPDQVAVMESISIATGGRVHSMVPFDPLKQVAFDLKQTTSNPLELVRDAIENRGFIGVKLYPPMGFAPYGNADLPRDLWDQEWLKRFGRRTDLGARLDDAMARLYRWCEKNEVPIMAHSGISNGPIRKFRELAGSKYWAIALREFKGLRINFGHFGDSDLGVGNCSADCKARGLMALMGNGPDAPGRNAYADAGYFIEGLSGTPGVKEVLKKLYAESNPGQAPLSTRFMYGTDWDMTLQQGKEAVGSFLRNFETLFQEIEAQPAVKSQGNHDLAAKFFGGNAVEWIGLRPGQRARLRLDKFYTANGVALPDWAKKVV
ncbi:MAG: amidohydrolase family protein [Acidovorax sp.]|uniref:amidohydrolase family protein n=1 Tax=Acidovorax sp. TaxID=1872122 RepID=UPI00391D3186